MLANKGMLKITFFRIRQGIPYSLFSKGKLALEKKSVLINEFPLFIKIKDHPI